MRPNPNALLVVDAARALGVSRQAVSQAVKRGRIDATKGRDGLLYLDPASFAQYTVTRIRPKKKGRRVARKTK
jgi:hypothetical protein